MSSQKSGGFSRRQVLQVFGAAAGAAAIGSRAARGQNTGGRGPVLAILRDAGDAVANSPQVTWAMGYLGEALRAATIRVAEMGAAAPVSIFIGGTANERMAKAAGLDVAALPHGPESVVVAGGNPRGTSALTVLGSDSLGLVYGLTELADLVRLSPSPWSDLLRSKPAMERPANKVRSICRVFVSEMEDKPWFYDRAGWVNYLDMLVTNRFNRLNLSLGLGYDFSTRVPDAYFFFAYPFFLDVPGYKVRVIDKNDQPLPVEERDKNLDTLKFISDECDKRGLHFQLGLWTHSISWPKNIANYTIDGISTQTQATYSRDALHALLAACPNIKGVTIRTHGESGVPEGNFDLWKVIFTGTQGLLDGRKVEIDLHAKGITQEIIDGALATGNPVTISPKFWAEHMGLPYMQASIRENEMPRKDGTGLMALSTGSRNFLRYGYGDLLKSNRNYRVIHRVFPGTQKLLLWGDPVFAAEYGKNFNFSGTDGVEYIEPLGFKGREGSSWEVNRGCYADASLKAKNGEGDWEKYAYTYRLWGRLAYNPQTDADVWRRLLNKEYGTAAEGTEKALASASRILPLITVAHLPSAAHASYWVEMYTNMSIYDASRPGPYGGDTPSPKDFVHVSPADPQLFATLQECAESLLSGKPLGKISPVSVAAQLQKWAEEAAAAALPASLVDRPANGDGQFRRMSNDTTIAIGLGQFFAQKFRAGILFAIYDLTGHAPARTAAVMAYRRARDIWAKFVDQTQGTYVKDITFGSAAQLRGDWQGRLAAIDEDVAGMESRAARASRADLASAADAAMQKVNQPPEALAVKVAHTPPAKFQPGAAIPLAFSLTGLAKDVSGTLWYRHLNQGERYQSAALKQSGAALGDSAFVAAIPAEYSKSEYPLEYYAEFHTPAASGGTDELLYPGFRDNFLGQPYFVIPQG